MKVKSVIYIYRYPSPQYFSIENIFFGIESYFKLKFRTQCFKVKHTGATPSTLLANLKKFKRNKNSVYHITGDVHYMALVTGKKTVLTIHDVGSATSDNFLKSIYIKFFWFWLPALFVSRITVISEFTKNELSKLIPFAKSKIIVVPNYVDPTFKPIPLADNRKPVILFIGTKPNKNLELSLKAIRDISCKILIIGDLTKKQKEVISNFNLDVSNKSNISRLEIRKSYESCDILCFASTYEGFGMPIIEAQALGRPVVTSNFGAMKEVAAESACLVDPEDENAIRQGVLKILEVESYKNKLIKSGLENCQRFDIEKITADYQKIYEELS